MVEARRQPRVICVDAPVSDAASAGRLCGTGWAIACCRRAPAIAPGATVGAALITAPAVPDIKRRSSSGSMRNGLGHRAREAPRERKLNNTGYVSGDQTTGPARSPPAPSPALSYGIMGELKGSEREFASKLEIRKK